MEEFKPKRKRGRPSENTKTNREQLLQIALSHFALNGFEGTNIRALSKEVGVASSLFYYHFTDKLGLWKAALQLVAQKLGGAMNAEINSIQQLDKLDFLKVWMRELIYFSAQNPEFHQIISYELAHPSPRADWLLEEVLQPLHHDFQKQMQGLQQEGLIKELPLAHFISIAIGAANIFFTQAYQMEKLYGVKVFEAAAINEHVNVVLEIFLNGIIKTSK